MMELRNKIQTGIEEFQQNTYFIANYLKCNLVTRGKLKDLIDDGGKIEGTGLFVLIRYDVPDNECHIGMGEGPTYSTVLI
jgi:hypothetical protein